MEDGVPTMGTIGDTNSTRKTSIDVPTQGRKKKERKEEGQKSVYRVRDTSEGIGWIN